MFFCQVLKVDCDKICYCQGQACGPMTCLDKGTVVRDSEVVTQSRGVGLI